MSSFWFVSLETLYASLLDSQVSSTNSCLFLLLQNQKLHIENRLLREKTNGLLTENEELRQRLGLDTLDSKEKVRLQCKP